MKNINLVIQRTFNGLEVVYNDEFVKTLENKEGIQDMLKNLIYFMEGMVVLKQPYQNQNCLQCSNKSILDKII